VALSRDITERKQSEARTHQLAYFDPLTGLANRRMLLDRLDNALAWARNSHEVGALLFIDLDNFKQINDARGHRRCAAAAGTAAGGLLRPGDTLARLGGDEFVLLLNDVAPDMESAGRAALLVGEQSEPHWSPQHRGAPLQQHRQHRHHPVSQACRRRGRPVA
jgi:GGDEF domain-containing protein